MVMVKVRGRILERAGRIKDAHGRRVTQLDPVAMHLLRRRAVIPAEPLRDIAEQLDRRWTRYGHLVLLVYAFGLLFCYAVGIWFSLFVIRDPRLDLVKILFGVVQFAILFGSFYTTWLLGRRLRFPRICVIVLQHRRCPHCGYDLRLLPSESQNGTTVCPECGCAWTMDAAVLAERLAATATPEASTDRQKKALVVIGLLLGAVALVGLLVSR